MEYQKIFREKYVDQLRRGVKDNSLVKFYESGQFEYEKEQVLILPNIIKPANIPNPIFSFILFFSLTM